MGLSRLYRLKFFIFDGLEFLVYSCLVLQPYIGIPFFTAVISIKPVRYSCTSPCYPVQPTGLIACLFSTVDVPAPTASVYPGSSPHSEIIIIFRTAAIVVSSRHFDGNASQSDIFVILLICSS